MSIKLIAVDMDGTFLSDQKKYDEAHEQLSIVLCGKGSAYVLDNVSGHFF